MQKKNFTFFASLTAPAIGNDKEAYLEGHWRLRGEERYYVRGKIIVNESKQQR